MVMVAVVMVVRVAMMVSMVTAMIMAMTLIMGVAVPGVHGFESNLPGFGVPVAKLASDPVKRCRPLGSS